MKRPYQSDKEEQTDALVVNYIPLVKKIAYKMAARIAGAVSVEDLIQTGTIGLIEAAKRFDSKRDNQFKTYAEFRIRGAMLDDLRNRDWIPRTVREAATKLERALTILRNKGIDSPNDETLCETLDIPPEGLHAFLLKAKPIMLFSFEDINSAFEDQADFLETVSNPEEDTPEDSLFKNFDKNQLAEAITKLNEKEQTVLALYYQEDLNLKEIANILEITESRVSQIRTKAIAGLKGILRKTPEEE